MERIPLIIKVSLSAADIQLLQRIKEGLADLCKRMSRSEFSHHRFDITLLLGAAFSINEVLRLAHITENKTISYELRMAIIKIETSFEHYKERVPKTLINDIANLMKSVNVMEAILLKNYKQANGLDDSEQYELLLEAADNNESK